VRSGGFRCSLIRRTFFPAVKRTIHKYPLLKQCGHRIGAGQPWLVSLSHAQHSGLRRRYSQQKNEYPLAAKIGEDWRHNPSFGFQKCQKVFPNLPVKRQVPEMGWQGWVIPYLSRCHSPGHKLMQLLVKAYLMVTARDLITTYLPMYGSVYQSPRWRHVQGNDTPARGTTRYLGRLRTRARQLGPGPMPRRRRTISMGADPPSKEELRFLHSPLPTWSLGSQRRLSRFGVCIPFS